MVDGEVAQIPRTHAVCAARSGTADFFKRFGGLVRTWWLSRGVGDIRFGSDPDTADLVDNRLFWGSQQSLPSEVPISGYWRKAEMWSRRAGYPLPAARAN